MIKNNKQCVGDPYPKEVTQCVMYTLSCIAVDFSLFHRNVCINLVPSLYVVKCDVLFRLERSLVPRRVLIIKTVSDT